MEGFEWLVCVHTSDGFTRNQDVSIWGAECFRRSALILPPRRGLQISGSGHLHERLRGETDPQNMSLCGVRKVRRQHMGTA